MTEQLHDTSARRTRKAFARRQWRRRLHAWRYVVVVLVLAGLAGLASWALWYSHWLEVKGVDVVGTQQITDKEVRRAAGVPMDGPLVDVDLNQVKSRVAALAEVEDVNVSRQWPDQVLIDVTEREPIAVVEIGDRTRALDSHGALFLEYKKPPAGLPVVVTPPGTDRAALQEAAEVVSSLPDSVAPKVEHVEVESVDQITLALDGGGTVVWGSASESETKAKVLSALLDQNAEVYDVSVPGQPTTSG